MPDLWLYWLAAALLLGMALRTVVNAAVHLVRAPVIKQAEVDRWADRQRTDDMDIRISNLVQLIRDTSAVINDHTHCEYAPLEHEHAHEHPHEHEHVQHVHQLEDLSREITEGRPVVVKRCRYCATIFRDEAS